jgi:hypothetical protein
VEAGRRSSIYAADRHAATIHLLFAETREENPIMPNMTVVIPHQLGTAEARRRIQEQLAHIQRNPPALLNRLEERWHGDTLDFTVFVAGLSITGQMVIEDRRVRIEVALPWVLGLFVNRIRQVVEKEGRALLGRRQAG